MSMPVFSSAVAPCTHFCTKPPKAPQIEAIVTADSSYGWLITNSSLLICLFSPVQLLLKSPISTTCCCWCIPNVCSPNFLTSPAKLLLPRKLQLNWCPMPTFPKHLEHVSAWHLPCFTPRLPLESGSDTRTEFCVLLTATRPWERVQWRPTCQV